MRSSKLINLPSPLKPTENYRLFITKKNLIIRLFTNSTAAGSRIQLLDSTLEFFERI